jgi:hypothetical protein
MILLEIRLWSILNSNTCIWTANVPLTVPVTVPLPSKINESLLSILTSASQRHHLSFLSYMGGRGNVTDLKSLSLIRSKVAFVRAQVWDRKKFWQLSYFSWRNQSWALPSRQLWAHQSEIISHWDFSPGQG